MTDSLNGIINQLERQKTAIERALTALRGVEGIEAPAPAPEMPARKGKKRSAAVRKRMKEAQRLRWARIRGESEPAPANLPEPSKPKRRISAEGMKRIIAATKKRWRLQKAAAKKAPTKRAAPVGKAALKKSAPAPAVALAQTAG
jgi:valyl-tRNA synthetase